VLSLQHSFDNSFVCKGKKKLNSGLREREILKEEFIIKMSCRGNQKRERWDFRGETMDNFESSSSLLFLFFTLKKFKTATMVQQLEDSLARNLMLRTNLLVRFIYLY